MLKLADRLHNMRTMDAMPACKQAEKASETAGLFVPLAHFLGLHQVGAELSELSDHYLGQETQPQSASGNVIPTTPVPRPAAAEDRILTRGWELSHAATHASMPPEILLGGLCEQRQQSHHELSLHGGGATRALCCRDYHSR